MEVLVVGGGGREHALCWKLAGCESVEKVYCAPGNAGIASVADCVALAVGDIEGLAGFAKSDRIGLTVVGPEAPLTEGLADRFAGEGLPVFGPSRSAAEIEGSKVFAKDLMKKAAIPTAEYGVFTDREKALDFARSLENGAVVKADGLAAGKGVIVCPNMEDVRKALDLIMLDRAFGAAGDRVVVEELLTGEEASFLAFTDGKEVLPMTGSQDHKPIFDGDKGPNTGGMGAYSPAPVITGDIHDLVMRDVMIPAMETMSDMGRPYKGVLYAGLMIEKGRPKVLEFNARFGDPETQPLMMRMKGDLAQVMLAAIDGELASVKLEWDPRPAVCVVMASAGYPGKYEKGKKINGLDKAAEMDNAMVFHAGTKKDGENIVTNGGRVLGVAALGDDVKDAIDNAYRVVDKISWEGVQYRKDIGAKALNR